MPSLKSSNRIALLLAGLMCAASVGAMMVRPTRHLADLAPPVALEAMVPKAFGNWREEPLAATQVVNPQTRQLLDKLYSQILTRTYVGDGYRIMLSIAYGGDQREGLQAHRPEICYPAYGFSLRRSEPAQLVTAFGTISARRLLATLGQRQEPVTYWYTVGNQSVDGNFQKKWVEMRFGLTGRIPDGMLFRISSIDSDIGRAYRLQDQFIGQLLAALAPADRLRLAGLAAPPAGPAGPP